MLGGAGIDGEERELAGIDGRRAVHLHPNLSADHTGGLGAARGRGLVRKVDGVLQALRGIDRDDRPRGRRADGRRLLVGHGDP